MEGQLLVEGNALVSLLPFVAIAVLFWFLLIRPQRNRQRQLLTLQRALIPGQQVMTNSGLYATVSGVEDDAVMLEVAPGVTCRYSKAAVVSVVNSSGGEHQQEDSSDSST